MYALKLELKLNNQERSRMASCAGYARFVYNYGLALMLESWGFEGVKAGDGKRLAAIKKVFTNHRMQQVGFEWMANHPSTIYQSAFQNLTDAFARWRKGLAEMPTFKSKKRGDSFTVYRTSGIYPAKGQPALPFTNRVVQEAGKRITLPGLGTLRLKEAVPFTCSSQTFTLTRQGTKWYVSFLVDAERIPPTHHPVAKVGIDLGIKCFATLSNGKTYHAPQSLKIAKTKRSKLAWRNRNKQMGNRKQGIRASRNAKKFYRQLADKHARSANIRRDFLQKTTTEISRTVAVIRLEDLNVRGMMANHKLSAALADVGLYETRRMLTYKQAHYGTQVELVDRWFPSSKTCSKCHHIQPMPLRERVFHCQNPACGHIQDRDENAAVNLECAPPEKVRLAN